MTCQLDEHQLNFLGPAPRRHFKRPHKRKDSQRSRTGRSVGSYRIAMASLASVTVVQPVAVKGLAGSSFDGTKLPLKPSRRISSRAKLRAGNGAVVAKYGEKSVYFDLEDIPNTTGQWDLYGSDAPSPYNPLQSKFFETFAAPFTKRGLLLKFLLLGGGFTIAYLGATAPSDILPIKKGPQQPPTAGPRGKI